MLCCALAAASLAARDAAGGMAMLANLLPGLRDLRGPLAVGYTWILVLWLLFADHLPRERSESSGAMGKLFDLGDLLGPTVILAVVSFVAYMIGSFLSLDPRGPVWRTVRNLWSEFRPGSSRTYEELSRWFDRHNIPQEEFNLLQLEAKLRVASADLYGDVDRLRSEAELRLNIAPAIAALSIVLTVQMSIWYVLGLAMAFILVLQGVQRLTRGNELTMQALMAGVIKLEGPTPTPPPP
jgi:hypothetical protein